MRKKKRKIGGQAEGMTAGDEYRMMLMMAERHAQEMSEHRKMVEKETRERRREARERIVEGMEEMIEKGHGKVTFGSEGIRPRGFIERKKEEREMGQRAEGRVLLRHLAEAKREEEAKKMWVTGKGWKWKVKDRQTPENEADERELLEHLLQDTGEERSCVEQKTEREQDEEEEMQAEMMNVAAVTQGRGETTTKAMIAAAAAAERDEQTTTTVAAAAAGRDEQTTTTIAAAATAGRDEETITTSATAATVEREEKTTTTNATAATAERDEITATQRISECIVEQVIDVLVPQVWKPTVEEVKLFSWVQPRTVEQIVDVSVLMQGQEPVIQKAFRIHRSCTLTGSEIRQLCCNAENLPL